MAGVDTPSRIGWGSVMPRDGANCGALVGVTEGIGVAEGRIAAVGKAVRVARGVPSFHVPLLHPLRSPQLLPSSHFEQPSLLSAFRWPVP